MRWMIWICVELLLFLVTVLVRWTYRKEDRLVYLNDYEFVETLKEPQRSAYLKRSEVMTLSLIYGLMLLFLLGAILYPVMEPLLFTLGFVGSCVIFSIVMILRSMRLMKAYKE